jgi:hypothetical protein
MQKTLEFIRDIGMVDHVINWLSIYKDLTQIIQWSSQRGFKNHSETRSWNDFKTQAYLLLSILKQGIYGWTPG